MRTALAFGWFRVLLGSNQHHNADIPQWNPSLTRFFGAN
jgi:hypothetical protein